MSDTPEVDRVDGSDAMPRLMNPTEFRERGYLQEVNRLVLHPLGLCMTTRITPSGDEVWGGVLDFRDEPTGVQFEGIDLESKANAIDAELSRKRQARKEALGWVIQPRYDQ